jgi:hypothetical protein
MLDAAGPDGSRATMQTTEVRTLMGMARTVAAVFGAIYLFVGIIGFVVATPLFGLFHVNGLHNLVHIALGGGLLYGATSAEAAIQASRWVGAVLFVLGLLGFVSADGFGFMPLGGNDIWLHLSSGAILLATGIFETAEEPV